MTEETNKHRKTFSRKVAAKLRKAGWTVGRDDPMIEQEYARFLGRAWVPAAGPFVRSFGGLSISHKLWIEPIPEFATGVLLERITQAIGRRVCPVAVSGYMGDGCSLWLDEGQYFYVADAQGMYFVGENWPDLFETILCGAPLPAPPVELREALERAVRWEINIDPRTGEMRIEDLMIGPETTRSAFLKSRLGSISEETMVNLTARSYSYDVEQGDQKVSISITFEGECIDRIGFRVLRYSDPDDWSEESIKIVEARAAALLRRELGAPPYDYHWGRAGIGIDNKGGQGWGGIEYRRRS